MPLVGLTDSEILLPLGGFDNATSGIDQPGNLIAIRILRQEFKHEINQFN